MKWPLEMFVSRERGRGTRRIVFLFIVTSKLTHDQWVMQTGSEKTIGPLDGNG